MRFDIARMGFRIGRVGARMGFRIGCVGARMGFRIGRHARSSGMGSIPLVLPSVKLLRLNI